MTSLRILTVGCAVLVPSFAGATAMAQELGFPRAGSPAVTSEAAPAPEGWGTATLSVLNINAFGFVEFDGAAVSGSDNTASRYMVSGNPCFEGTIHLPTGAIIDHVELEACDTVAPNLTSSLFGCSNGICTSTYTVGSTGAGGCARFASAVGTQVIHNNATTYVASVCAGTTGVGNSFRAYRIFYRLQVSAAPAVATFPNDVPTSNPFFRFVEAMAASGLTGGCAPGSFCPDQPVTRGQLAVFLSSALGLHFPN